LFLKDDFDFFVSCLQLDIDPVPKGRLVLNAVFCMAFKPVVITELFVYATGWAKNSNC